LAIVTNVGTGCGGRGSVGLKRNRRAGYPVSGSRHADDSVEAYGKTVWSWHPLLVSS